jgi:hypothetical protein
VQYDPQLPVAVFLGPSLDQQTAQDILPANYYPPVAMGDVYRLIASGVQALVIIDGVFHQTTPVWQREILAAIDAGITVFGASSMGALRAAELDIYGMHGCGQIYQWYRDGVIDGDDEVALLHAPSEHRFAPLSVPLVNLRFALNTAMQDGLVSDATGHALVADLKTLYFGARTHRRIAESAVWNTVDERSRDAFLIRLQSNDADLKRADALQVLRACAARLDLGRPTARDGELPNSPSRSAFPAVAAIRRGWWHPSGYLLDGEKVLDALQTDSSRAAALRRDAVRHWFLAQCADATCITVDEHEIELFEEQWQLRMAPMTRAEALRATGLTHAELRTQARERMRVRDLLNREPEALDLEFAAHRKILLGLRALLGTGDNAPSAAVLYHDVVEAAHIAMWARTHGVVCPTTVVDDFMHTWEARMAGLNRAGLAERLGVDVPSYERVWAEQATHEWLIGLGPAALGFTTWFEPAALLNEIQLTITAAELRDLGLQATRLPAP